MARRTCKSLWKNRIVLRSWVVKKKSLKTLKRARGNRQFRGNIPAKNGTKKKNQKGRKSKLKNKERARRPRSIVVQKQQPAVTRDTTQKAYNVLLRTGWCWKPKLCHCGGTFETLSFRHSNMRGSGRLFLRCTDSDCRSYKDVLCFSHLPSLRMPLSHIVEAMKCWFSKSCPPSADDVGRHLGLAGQSHSSLKKLFETLGKHESDLALSFQDTTSLSGRLVFIRSCQFWIGCEH